MDDQKECEANTHCLFNFNEMPSVEGGTCTHLLKYNDTPNVVYACKKMDKDTCNNEGKFWCQYNFDEEPNLVHGACTHLNEFRRNEEVVQYCKTLNEDNCKSSAKCKVNFYESPTD